MSRLYKETKDWDMSAWRNWLDSRLRGRDTRYSYDEDEHPVDIVLDMIPEFPRGEAAQSHLAFAVADLLKNASPETEDLLVLSGLIELAANLPARPAGKTVVQWIRDRVFLDRRKPPVPALHEALLYALAAMQRRGSPFHLEVARPFLRKPSTGITDETRLRQAAGTMTAAFAVHAMAAGTVPRKELRNYVAHILEIEQRLPAGARGVPIAPAVLALFTEPARPIREKQREIWNALPETAREQCWERLRRAVRHTDCALPSPGEMRHAAEIATALQRFLRRKTAPNIEGGLWDCDMSLAVAPAPYIAA